MLLLIFLFFLVVSETANVNLIRLSSETIDPKYIIYPLSILQVIFATLQAGLSDYYSRKKSIVFGFIVILISLCFFALSFWKYQTLFISLFIVFLGIGGNVMPMTLAALGDFTHRKNFRFILAIAITAIALGSFGSLHIDNYLSDSGAFVLTCVIVVLALLACFFLPNKGELASREKFSLQSECRTIFNKFIKNKTFLLALVGFLFVEISFYQIFLRNEALHNEANFKFVPIRLGIAYFLGTFVLKYSKATDAKNIIRGFWISCLSIIASFFLCFFGVVGSWLLWLSIIATMGYGYGYAIFTPSLFSLVSREHASHNYGKIFGLIDSVDTVAVITAFTIINYTSNINLQSIYLISALIIIIAGVSFFVLIRKKYAAKNSLLR